MLKRSLAEIPVLIIDNQQETHEETYRVFGKVPGCVCKIETNPWLAVAYLEWSAESEKFPKHIIVSSGIPAELMSEFLNYFRLRFQKKFYATTVWGLKSSAREEIDHEVLDGIMAKPWTEKKVMDLLNMRFK